jgi:hypothetical protein
MTGPRFFGFAWTGFALALAAHVADEAAHDFLSVYNPTVEAVRARLPFLPLPTFGFEIWLGGLIAGILLLLALAPLAFRGNKWLARIAWFLAIVVGILNACGHFAGSLWLGRPMPGVVSAPLLFVAGIVLLLAARRVTKKSAA